MSGGVKEVLCYLAGIFGAGMSYSSINVSRSMLSSTLNMGIGNSEEIGKHLLVTRLMSIFLVFIYLPEYLNDSVSKLCIIAKGPDCEIKIPH
jgi:hypothetical protein